MDNAIKGEWLVLIIRKSDLDCSKKETVLKRILSVQDEAKGKFAPNWQGPFIVNKILPGGALILTEMDEHVFPQPINSDMCKKYFI